MMTWSKVSSARSGGDTCGTGKRHVCLEDIDPSDKRCVLLKIKGATCKTLP